MNVFRTVVATATLLFPIAASAATIPLVTLSVPIAVTAMTAPPGSAPKLFVECVTSTADISDLNLPANATTLGTAFQATGVDAHGAPGRLLNIDYRTVPLDATGSYAGPPIVFSFFASDIADAKLAKSYACELFGGAPYVTRLTNGLVNGLAPYTTFQSRTGGPVR